MALFNFMDRNVFSQVDFLGKSGNTSFNLAREWLLSGVSPKMIKEIVPFPKDHSAVLIATLQQSDCSLGLGILVPINQELVGFGCILFDLKSSYVKSGSVLYFYRDSLRNRFFESFFFKLIPLYYFSAMVVRIL
jgi:hypothetical protein